MINDAMRNKRDLEIFIGSLPPNCDERELKEYFKSKKVKVANIRILRSTFYHYIQTTKGNPNASVLHCA